MPDIRYVCLSDMHLGEEDSLLTNLETAGFNPDPSKPSPVLESLVKCLRDLIDKNQNGIRPTLILNGDILELALASTNQAAMAFERFIELVMQDDDPLFDHIVYIPGNHDHHIWEIARETKYVHYLRTIQPGEAFEAPEHITKMFVKTGSTKMRTRAFEEPIASYLLSNLVQRHSHLMERKFVIEVVYPNFGLRSKDGQKCVIFHHGHFTESIYHLMSTFKHLCLDRKMPTTIEDIETENFAWIDFFWSTMGRSGEAGEAIETIYEYMCRKKHFEKLASQFVKNLDKEYNLPGWDWLDAKLLEKILHWLAGKFSSKRERADTTETLSEDTENRLWAYLEGPLLKQIREECSNKMPSEVSFVFGHTHKPFQEAMSFEGYGWVDVYNTGGWVVDTEKPEKRHGGAVILVDENLDLTSLHMYKEWEESDDYVVSVKEATRAVPKDNPFYPEIVELVSKKEENFRAFSEIAKHSVYDRAQRLRSRLKKFH